MMGIDYPLFEGGTHVIKVCEATPTNHKPTETAHSAKLIVLTYPQLKVRQRVDKFSGGICTYPSHRLIGAIHVVYL